MAAAWVRFAATGDPNGPGLPAWPTYGRETDRHLEFADLTRAAAKLHQEQFDFWEQAYARLRAGRGARFSVQR